jgi:predicted DNA-binding transcriptional regulator AlpA
MPRVTLASSTQDNNVKKVFWRFPDLVEATGLSHRQLARLRASGRLPKPDAIFGTALCWLPKTVSAWAQTGGMADQNAR